MLLEDTKTLEDAIQELQAERAALYVQCEALQRANTRQARTILELAGKAEQYRYRARMLRQQAMRWREMHSNAIDLYLKQLSKMGILRGSIETALRHIPMSHRGNVQRALKQYDHA